MPKIGEVIQSHKLPLLNRDILNYFQKHTDEVFSAADATGLANLIGYNGASRDVVYALWDLYKKGLISKERVGKWVYFGSKEAIIELRRHTRQPKGALEPSQGQVDIISIPGNIPLALTHVLQVIYLIKKNGFSRIDATVEVARKWNISRQTIQDKYCRQLGISTAEIDGHLRKSDLSELASIIKNKYPAHIRYIDGFFDKLRG